MKIGLTSIFVGYQEMKKLIIISLGIILLISLTIENITPEAFTGSGLPEAYAEVAPNPNGWATLVEKMKKLDLEYIGRTPEEFRSIKAPTLIVIGDSDGIPPESAVEMFKLLGGGDRKASLRPMAKNSGAKVSTVKSLRWSG